MKTTVTLLVCILVASCGKNEAYDILYHNLLEYRSELKYNLETEEMYLENLHREDNFRKKRFDSLSKISHGFEAAFEKNKYGDRSKLLEIRNEFKRKHKLYLKFYKSNYDEDIPDSVFHKIIETDILRLRQEFQSRYMYMRGCK
jgi:hypothetical protein